MALTTVKDWYASVGVEPSKKQLARQRKVVAKRTETLAESTLLDAQTTHRLWQEVARVFQEHCWWDEEKHFLWEMVPQASRLPLALESSSYQRIILFEMDTAAAAMTTDGEGLLRRAKSPRWFDAWIIEFPGMLHCVPHEPYEQPFSVRVRFSRELREQFAG
jgi:hypothetical protein